MIPFLLLAALLPSAMQEPAMVSQTTQDLYEVKLAEAKQLYGAAEYESALTAIEQVDPIAITPAQDKERAVYKALCLLALNRPSEADATVAALFQAQPLVDLEPQTPPRLRALLEDVKKRLGPAVVQETYRAAKDRFDARDYPAALAGFSMVVALANALPESPLSDIRLVATGFRELSRASIGPVPMVARDAESRGEFVLPVVVRQQMPPWPTTLRAVDSQGIFEVSITAAGDVGSVKVIRSIHPLYDRLVIDAAQNWKYRPATQSGQDVPYVKRLVVNIDAK